LIAHWDDVEPERADNAVLGFDGYDLGEAAGTVNVGLTRTKVDAGLLEAALGPLELPAPSARRANVVNVDDVEEYEGWRNLARAAGSLRTGLKHVTVPPGQLHCPPHCHAQEEEIFVVLDGEGTLELTPSPGLVDDGATPEQHAVRAGHVVSRPAGTGIAHAFRSGEHGMTLLAYGEKKRHDVLYYPRSNKIMFRGVGVIARLDHLQYEVGEESPC
jgi:uncharacterized cupin superfamily protein